MCASGVLLDFANRLPRGRTYARRGSIWHLQIHPGRIDAKVHGSPARPYQVTIQVSRLPDATWKAIRNACSGQIGSLLELLRGSLSDRVMALVTDPAHGLFPQPRKLDCRCPDWANRCKHVAAVLYGAGNRLERSPGAAVSTAAGRSRGAGHRRDGAPEGAADPDILADDQLSGIFGIELDADPDASAPTA